MQKEVSVDVGGGGEQLTTLSYSFTKRSQSLSK